MTDLFHQAHSATSRAAAESMEPHVNRLQKKVLDALRLSRHGESDESLGQITGLPQSTLRPRRVELVNKGLIKDSGETRKTLSGRSATVWIAIG